MQEIKSSSTNSGLEAHDAAAVAEHVAHEEHTPLSQFEVKKIFDFHFGSIDLSLTNSALYMVLATAFAILFILLLTFDIISFCKVLATFVILVSDSTAV